MPKMPGGDEKKEETAESKEEAAEQVNQLFLNIKTGKPAV